MTAREFTVLFPFCGLGGGGLGLLESSAALFGANARFVSLGGIDIDDAACQDFVYLTKSPALCADIAELTPARLREFAGVEPPDVVFLSAPCVGASKLVSDKKAATRKYRKMNVLGEVWVDLMLRTWRKPVGVVLFENVPNLTSAKRGDAMLRRVKAKLRKAGYVLHDGNHCCGEIGGLGQRRKRWLMVARHAETVPPLLYQPPKRRVRGCGEIIGPMPMPGDPAGGAMHTLPRISWLNWVRLALIPAGGDWRDLRDVLAPGQKRREKFKRHEVCAWDQPTGVVGGSGSNGVANVADERARVFALSPSPNRHDAKYTLRGWEQPVKTVTGATRPGSGSQAVADVRIALPNAFDNVLRVNDWGEPSGTVTTAGSPSNGLICAADPRGARFANRNRVTPWDEPTATVTTRAQPASGGPAVADPRIEVPKAFSDGYGVLAFESPSGAVTGSANPTRGRFAVADRRVPKAFKGGYQVQLWEEPASTVTGEASVSNGASVADTRFGNVDRVTPWDEPVGTITHSPAPSSGAPAVADARVPTDPEAYFHGLLGVMPWEEPAKTVTGSSAPSRGPSSVADPRPGLLPGKPPFDKAYGVLRFVDPAHTIAAGSNLGQGAYAVADIPLRCKPRAGAWGVLSWDVAAKTITGAAGIDNGPFAIADTRIPNPPPLCIVRDVTKAPEGTVPIILAADGTWHRPLTTLEFARLQDLPLMVDGAPLKLAGNSHTEWRKRIGNCVPVGAARAIGDRILTNLLAAASGAFVLSGDGAVWVAPRKTRGKVDDRSRVRVHPRKVAKMERAAVLGCDA